jgi:hypothetical protein
MNADASLNKQIAEIRQFQVALTPTARATNQVQLSGRVDISQTNAYQGNLKLVADSLDLTTYYDLFGAQKKGPEKAPAPGSPQPSPPTSPTPARPEQEPEAKQLPLRNFVAEAAIRRLYLHEVEIADFQTTTKIDGGHVVVNPCKLALNNAPVSATIDLDLGVPGFKYDLAFDAQAVPLTPFVNTFQPQRKGLLSGTLTAHTKVVGAGTTGASLQKSLTGQFDLNSTNLNLSVDNIPGDTVSGRLLKTVVSAIVLIPDMLKNPGGTGLGVAQNLVGLGGSGTGGSTVDLKKSIINAILLSGKMGAGRVNLQQAVVRSPAFEADATGTITLASVLTNSPIDIPVSVLLERSVAQRLSLAGNTPTNAPYAKLPDFLALKGTLGEPKRDIKTMVLVGAALQGASGLAVKNQVLLQSLGGALSGSSTSSGSGTNQPAKGGSSLLQGLGGLLGGTPPPNTNVSPGTATNQPTQSPAGNLLNQLFKPKK